MSDITSEPDPVRLIVHRPDGSEEVLELKGTEPVISEAKWDDIASIEIEDPGGPKPTG